MSARYTNKPSIHPKYARRLPRSNAKPPRPRGHIETVSQLGERVVVHHNDQYVWPKEQYDILYHWFPETVYHRREQRWSRRRNPLQPIVWEGALGHQPPPPPPPPPAAASA